jgi:hypothetical protein
MRIRNAVHIIILVVEISYDLPAVGKPLALLSPSSSFQSLSPTTTCTGRLYYEICVYLFLIKLFFSDLLVIFFKLLNLFQRASGPRGDLHQHVLQEQGTLNDCFFLCPYAAFLSF